MSSRRPPEPPTTPMRIPRPPDTDLVLLIIGLDRRVVPLDGDVITIGKSADNTIVIDDPRVSKHHLVLRRVPGGFAVEDLDSTNGIFIVTSATRTQTRFREGTWTPEIGLRIGETELWLELRFPPPTKGEAPELLGVSPAIQLVKERINRLAPSRAHVLIQGPTGTGKDLVAKLIHAQSKRSAGPFITVTGPEIRGDTARSELFGHVPGAFTGATTTRDGTFKAADGGTLFLNEVADLHPSSQDLLLGAMDTGEYRRVGALEVTLKADVRVVAASLKDLRDQIDRELFREDLYYRFRVGRIDLPPLVDRREDIPILANHFAAKLDPSLKVHDDAVKVLVAHSWPGNIRELASAIEEASLGANGGIIHAKDLRLEPPRKPKGAAHGLDSVGIAQRNFEELHLEIVQVGQ